MTKHRLQPAAGILEALGGKSGVAVVSKITGVDRIGVWRWTQPKTKRGTGGLVPPQFMAPLLTWAQENGKHLTAEMFVQWPSSKPARASRSRRASVECSSV